MSREDFGRELNRHVRPAVPVDSVELLQGREKELRTIEHALYQEGSHIFIYGDRGVGKSSLAQTAAGTYQSSKSAPLKVGCTDDTTFLGAMTEIARKAFDPSDPHQVTTKTEVNLKLFRYERTKSRNKELETGRVESRERALDLMRDIRDVHPMPVIVIDEFDAIQDMKERETFAKFLKMMADAHIWIPFIFSGIASSLDALLGGHGSSYRQIEAVYLDRLSWDARWDIFKNALNAFGIKYHEDIPYRIAGISDGFPYYVHLVTAKLLWAVFEAEEEQTSVGLEQYLAGVAEAANSIAPHLKVAYEKATERPSGEEFHYVIWGAAATADLRRTISEMYESYCDVIVQARRHLKDEAIVLLDRPAFGRRLNCLSRPAYGPLLKRANNRRGWYEFAENMIRGYAKLVAELNGVEIWKKDAKGPRQYTSIPWGRVAKHARYRGPTGPSGYRGSTIWGKR
jgi:hypothetical protein